MLYALIPLCLCLAGVFLWQESKKNYVPAVILKGLASLCFVILGFGLSKGSPAARLITVGLLLGCIADVLLNCVAVGNLIASPSAFTGIFAAGSLLFLVSDIVLILNTFGKETKQCLRVTNVGLYYAGQILIALSLLFLK